MNNEYLSTTETKNILKVTPQTLRDWASKDKIRSIRTPSGQRHYNKEDVFKIVGISTPIKQKKRIIYCRVSSKKQMDDLERQTDFLKSKYPSYIVVTDIASGINWKRKGLKTILEQSMLGDVEEIVVAHRDRLCRFAFELLEFIFNKSGTKLIIHNENTEKSTDQELADDILSIVHVYSCRNMGRRRYSNPKNKVIPVKGTETNV